MEKEFNEEREYWDEFYRSPHLEIREPTWFAEYVYHKWVGKRKTVLECGCGNGRDSLYFSKHGLDVTGTDTSAIAIEKLRLGYLEYKFLCTDFVDSETIYSRSYDLCYSRFSIHAISLEQEQMLYRNVFRSLNNDGLFCIEARSIHDELYGKGEKVAEDAYRYDSHYRRFLKLDDLLVRLLQVGFSIKYAEENKGFAPLNGDDPEIIRVVAWKV